MMYRCSVNTNNTPCLLPIKPLEVREANIKPSNHKVCVLGLWAAAEAEGQRLVELAAALESGRSGLCDVVS